MNDYAPGEPSSETPAAPRRAVDDATPLSLGTFLGSRRQLLVFTPSVQHAAFRRQKELLDEAALGLGERDVVLVEVVGPDLASASGQTLSPGAGERLRAQWNAPPDLLTVVLLGKDGHEKLRVNEPVSAGPLFALVDSLRARQI